MLLPFSLPLALPFLSVSNFPHRKLLLTEIVYITFYPRVENSATPKIPCSDFINVLQLLLFCHSPSMTALLQVFRGLGLQLSHCRGGRD